MVQKIHPLGVIWDPNFAPYVERFQILKLLSKCSILEPSLIKHTFYHCRTVKFTVSDVCSTDWPKKDSANFESQNFEGP